MTPLEKAARASYEASGDAGIRMPPWDKIPPLNPLKANRIRDVRAALEALMPPEADSIELDNMPWSGIVNAGHEAASKAGFAIGDADWYAPRHIFEAMLRKVLEP